MLSSVAGTAAKAMEPLVRAFHGAPDVEKQYYQSVLDRMVRHLEYFLVPGVSEAADAVACKLGLGDLRRRPWGHKPTRTALKWEHHPPVADILKAIFELDEPSAEAIEPILKVAGVNWVTPEEEASLPKYNRGPDLRAAYAKIKMLHHCERG
jgi:hypothetical protein